ncbi:MAG: hypothetical protein V1861_03895 [Candidatus Micrarchaeota archaeon]
MGWEEHIGRLVASSIAVIAIAGLLAIGYSVLFQDWKEATPMIDIAGLGNNSGMDYYPAFLDKEDVTVEYYEDKTVITIDKKLTQWEVACTGSMHPAMGCGNTLLTEKISPSDSINIGDIVVYRSKGRYISHQVVAYDEDADCYRLKGSNSPYMDPECVKRDAMVAREVLIVPTERSSET